MIVGGLQKFSLLDYPEHLSAIIFTRGCNFRCHFCYNPMLVLPDRFGGISNISSPEKSGGEIKEVVREEDLFDFLGSRVGKLDAVVVTGGEPTIHADLPEFAAKIKKLGFKVKLDTNGTNPEMLASLAEERLIDYAAMDIKGRLDKYDILTGTQPDVGLIRESICFLIKGTLPYEFRTTVVPELIEPDDFEEIGRELAGAEKWFLQQFKSDTELVNPEFRDFSPYPDSALEKMRQTALKYVRHCEIR